VPEVVLVTGGSGFIGTWVLQQLLQQNAQPVVVDRLPALERWQRVLGKRAADVIWTQAELTDPESLLAAIRRHGVTHVIHLAALLTPACQQDPYLGCQVNVLGSTAVFDAARCSGHVRNVAYASSYAVYGGEADAVADESQRPPMFYGAFKQAVDGIAEQYWRHFQISSVAIRPHVVYGPEREQGLTAGPSLACRAAARGESYTIGYTGRAGYDYVGDVARAFVRAAFADLTGAHVVDLPSQPATTEEFVQIIESLVPGAASRLRIDGPPIPANVPAHPHYIAQLFPDWQPTSLQDGVRQTIAFYAAKQA
jgi:UDP-glucose 4-epimerase